MATPGIAAPDASTAFTLRLTFEPTDADTPSPCTGIRVASVPVGAVDVAVNVTDSEPALTTSVCAPTSFPSFQRALTMPPCPGPLGPPVTPLPPPRSTEPPLLGVQCAATPGTPFPY